MYAGQYVPAVSYAVFEAQQRGEMCAFLLGLTIDNSLTEPEIQHGAYADYALGVDLVKVEDAAGPAKSTPSVRR